MEQCLGAHSWSDPHVRWHQVLLAKCGFAPGHDGICRKARSCPCRCPTQRQATIMARTAAIAAGSSVAIPNFGDVIRRTAPVTSHTLNINHLSRHPFDGCHGRHRSVVPLRMVACRRPGVTLCSSLNQSILSSLTHTGPVYTTTNRSQFRQNAHQSSGGWGDCARCRKQGPNVIPKIYKG